MAYARLAAFLVAMVGFCGIGVPLQRLAMARGWRLTERIPRFYHRVMCRILRVRVRVEGRPADAVPQLIVANHVSWVDILALSTVRPLHFLAKREVRSWPIFGTFAVLQGSVFVDRDKPRDLPKVNAEIAERMRTGDRIVLFAESTTSDGTRMLRFRAPHFGAAQALLAAAPEIEAVTIQPTAVSYVSHDGRTSVAWIDDMDLAPHIWALLRGGPYDCHIRFGTPIRFDRASDRKRVMLETQAAVAAMLPRPVLPASHRPIPRQRDCANEGKDASSPSRFEPRTEGWPSRRKRGR